MGSIEDTLEQYLETSEEDDPIIKGIYLERLFEERLDLTTLTKLAITGKSKSDSRLVSRVKEEILSVARTFLDYERLYQHIRQVPDLYGGRFTTKVENRLIDTADNFIKILNAYHLTRMEGRFSFLLRIADKLLEHTHTFQEKSSVYKAAVLSNDMDLEEKSKKMVLETASFSELGKFSRLSNHLGRKLYWEITKERIRRLPLISSLFKRAA